MGHVRQAEHVFAGMSIITVSYLCRYEFIKYEVAREKSFYLLLLFFSSYPSIHFILYFMSANTVLK